jgi:uncharacterized protein YbjT (DUF2867 family)
MPLPTIALAGASGFIGSHIARELLARGYGVRGLVRDRERALRALPRDDRLKLIQGDVASDEAIAGLVAGAAACINAVGILRPEPAGQSFRKLHVDVPRRLARAAAPAGLRRIIHVSALGVGADARTDYLRTKFEGEQIIQRSGLDWTIFRPGLVHGPGSGFMELAAGWVRGTRQPWFFLPYFARGVVSSDVPLAAIRREPARVMPIAVEDVAWAIAQSLSNPDTVGEIINLVGPEELSWPELLEFIRDTVPGARRDLIPRGVPVEAAAIQARIAAKLGLGNLLPFDEGMAVMGSQDSTASPEKARLILNLSPRPFRESLRQYAARL